MKYRVLLNNKPAPGCPDPVELGEAKEVAFDLHITLIEGDRASHSAVARAGDNYEMSVWHHGGVDFITLKPAGE